VRKRAILAKMFGEMRGETANRKPCGVYRDLDNTAKPQVSLSNFRAEDEQSRCRAILFQQDASWNASDRFARSIQPIR
jgi:hypothetical protein